VRGRKSPCSGPAAFGVPTPCFRDLKGVSGVLTGYSGGTRKNPTYEEVCSGTTGHAESVRVVFDPAVVSYDTLLEAFWHSHDPTQLNRQGNDVGTQYRSAVFFLNDAQRDAALKSKARLDAAHEYPTPVVTEVTPFGEFYPAEGYHQDYFARNPDQPYCRAVVRPKVEKFRKLFADRLK